MKENVESFKKYGYQMVDWIASYMENIESYPVKSQVKPNDIYKELPEHPPASSESIETIMADFQDIIVPGMTHWQSPNFFAYFPANSSMPSLLAEMLISAMGAQCMIWDTSPAAAELEEKVMNWLKEMLDLPTPFEGVIQDTASTATLCALLSAREKFSDFQINEHGVQSYKFTVYCSTETHSSVEKAVKIAGLGRNSLRKIAVDEFGRMIPEQLNSAIEEDISNGFTPICVVAAMGTTGTTAMDPIESIAHICNTHTLWLHIDAAYAGTALILPEQRWMAKGVEHADSFVFNPHKWMFTNFDCSAYFVKDKETLIRTFEILPEYLKTASRGEVNDYRDWGVPLGRRFRALKLWFVIRHFGVEGIQEKIRTHIQFAQYLSNEIEHSSDFQLVCPTTLNLICFRYAGTYEGDLNEANQRLLNQLNASGKMYLTHTKVQGKYTIRMVIGQTHVTLDHVKNAWEIIQKESKQLFK